MSYKGIKNLLNRKRELSSDEEKSSDRERIIAIYCEKNRIIFKVKSFYHFFRVIEVLNMPYFFINGEKIYFNYDENAKFFWNNKKNKILYESELEMFVDKESFYGFHRNIKPKNKNLNLYYDFCSPYYYFSDEIEQTFINTLNETVINELKDTRYFNDKKIIRFFGPKKNGKSTLVYYYFGIRKYISLKEMNEIDNISEEYKDEINKKDSIIKDNNDEIINQNSNIIYKSNITNSIDLDENKKNEFLLNPQFFKLQNYDNISFKQKLEACDDIPNLDDNIIESLKDFGSDLSVEEFLKNKYNRDFKQIILQKEFKISSNDIIGFFRSCYLNNNFLKNNTIPDEVKIQTLLYEFEGLFKSYRIYKLFVAQFTDFYTSYKNIIEIGEFIFKFMKKYNKKIRYFLIFDSISFDLVDELKIFESIARKDENCFIIELFQNEKMQNIFYDNNIEKKIDEDVLTIYLETYSNYDLVNDLSNEENTFLIENFGQNLFYYQEYKKWKKENINKNKTDFLTIIITETKKELLKDFVNDEEGKAFYRYIYLNILYQNDIEEKIIKKLNLDFFFVTKKENNFKLSALPFVKLILKDFLKVPINILLRTDFFIKSEEYIKGGIIEDIAKQEIKNIFKNNINNKNDYQEVDIHRLLDNEIFTFYDEKTLTNILSKKKKYQEIKKKYKKQNLKFKDKVTIFNLYQNAKHYDLCILYYGKLLLFQFTINKKKGNIDELINFKLIDLNYIVHKIMDLTDEKDIIDKIYCYFVIAKMDLILENVSITPEIQKLLVKNEKDNERMIKSIKISNFDFLYLGREGKIYDKKNKLITKFKTPEKKYELYKNLFLNIYAIKTNLILKKIKIKDKLKNSINLPYFIKRETIEFYSFYYPKIEQPSNLITYFEYPKHKISFFKINNEFYDSNLNKSNDKNNVIFSHKSDIRNIMMFKYEFNGHGSAK